MSFVPKEDMLEFDLKRAAKWEQVSIGYDDANGSKKVVSDLVPKGALLRTVRGSTTTRIAATAREHMRGREIRGTEILDEYGVRQLFGHWAAMQLDPRDLVDKGNDVWAQEGDLLSNAQKFFQASLRLALPKPGNYCVQVLVGEPVQTLIDGGKGYKTSVRDALAGLHSFRALTGFSEGDPVYEEWNVYVQRVGVMEQTMGGLMTYILYPDGTGREEVDLPYGRIVLLDWGYGTCDVVTVDYAPSARSGEPGTFDRIDRLCGGNSGGIDVLYTYLRDNVFEQHGLILAQTELDLAIMQGYYVDNRRPQDRHPDADDEGKIDLSLAIGKGLQLMWHVAQELVKGLLGDLQAQNVKAFVLLGGASGFMRPFADKQFGSHRVHGGISSVDVSSKLPFKHLMSNELPLTNARGLHYTSLKSARA